MSEQMEPGSPNYGRSEASGGEDTFFVLRDCREYLQRRLEEVIRQSTNLGMRAIETFSKEFGEGFDELASSSQRDGFEQTKGLTASRISLVGNDDLELEIRIDELTGKLKDNDQIDIWQTQRRFMTLLRRPGMSADDNPAGLQPISCGLWALLREGGGTLDQKLDQLNHIEDFFQARLPAIYSELNAILEKHHVAALSAQPIQRTRENRPVNAAGSATPPATNVLATLQQAMRQKTGDGTPESDAANSGELQLPATGGGNLLDAATLVMLKHLMQRLSALETQKAADMQASEDQPLRAFTAKDFDLPLGQPAAIALDTLALIFDVIFNSPDLPDPLKAAIARLQIPLLKLALQDTSLFANEQHPARRLINRMARAAIGLSPEAGRDHPVCSALLRLADSIHAMLEAGDGALSPFLDQLETLITTRDQQHRDNAQPYIQLVIEHQAADGARRDAGEWLSRISGRTSEPSIRTFLAEYWQQVMRLASQDGGPRGARWQQDAATIDDLIWSLSPKQNADDRKKLLALIPQLLKRLNAGLDLLAVPKEARTPFLDACFELQTAALRGQMKAQQVPAASYAANISADNEAATQILERDGKLVQYLGRPTAQSSKPSRNKAWRVGDWVRFQLPDGENLCGQLCWQSEPEASILLFNQDWGYAVACAPALLERQLQTGEARIVTEVALFDMAAEKALQDIVPG